VADFIKAKVEPVHPSPGHSEQLDKFVHVGQLVADCRQLLQLLQRGQRLKTGQFIAGYVQHSQGVLKHMTEVVHIKVLPRPRGHTRRFTSPQPDTS